HHLVELIEELRNRGVAFRSVSDGLIDTTSPSGELIFHIFSALAQFERRLIQERTRTGLESARARGRLGGRPPVDLDEAKVRAARKLRDDHPLNIDDICKTLNISKSTSEDDVTVQFAIGSPVAWSVTLVIRSCVRLCMKLPEGFAAPGFLLSKSESGSGADANTSNLAQMLFGS